MKEDVARLARARKTQQLVYRLRIRQAMNRKVLTLTPEHTVEDMRIMLRTNRISGVPVAESGNLLGIVSIEDLINCLREGMMERRLKDVMTRDVVTLFSDEPLASAVKEFGKHGFGRFPVLDRKTGRLVGIITKKDTIRCLLKSLQSLYHARERRRGQEKQPGRLLNGLVADGTSIILRHVVKGGDFRRAGEKSDQLKDSLLSLGYEEDHIRRLIIAVMEAEMNLIIFTERGEITTCVEPGKITVRVVDNGPGIADIGLAMQPGYSTAPDFVRELGFGAGMGLPNIKRSSDEMKLESVVGKGTRLEFAVYN